VVESSGQVMKLRSPQRNVGGGDLKLLVMSVRMLDSLG